MPKFLLPKLFRSQKKRILAFLSFVSFALLLYPQDAKAAIPIIVVAAGIPLLKLLGIAVAAGIVGGIAAKLTGLIAAPLTFAAIIIGLAHLAFVFGAAFLVVGNSLFVWAIGRPFLGFSMTNPAQNYIIETGWTALRDLTNMFFILGLAYIGLATALNFGGFKTGKTFARLLIFALLINFTPVICGVIVDAANIITNFFLEGVDFSALITGYKNTEPTWTRILKDLFDPEAWATLLLINLFGFLAGFVLFFLALLFLLRHFIIWLLVIISPLAFFCGIFDKTKHYFENWWKHFINWSFIAVPTGFFLYLAHHFLTIVSKPPPGQPTGGEIQLTPYLVSVLFMVIGVIVALKINAAGSGAIMGAARKLAVAPKTIASAVSQKAAVAAEAFTKGALIGGGVGAAAGWKAASEAGTSRFKGAAKGWFTGTATSKGREEGLRTYHRRLEELRLKPTGYAEEMEAKRFDVAAEEKRLKGVTKAEERRKIAERATRLGAHDKTIAAGIAMLKKLAEDKDFDEKKDLDLLLKLKAKGINTAEADRAIKKALPKLVAALDPEKAQGKEIEHIKKTQPGITTDDQAKEYMENRREAYIENEIRRLKAEGLSDKEARVQAKINIRLEIPEISKTIKIEMAQDQLSKMDAGEIRKNLQIKDLDTLTMLDPAHIEILEMAPKKQRESIDNVLRENKEEIADIIRNERAGYEKLMNIMNAIYDSPAFVAGGPGRRRGRRREEEEETAGEEETSPTA